MASTIGLNLSGFYRRFSKASKSIKNMAKEVRSGPVKITVSVAESLRKRFNKHCKKMNVTAAQWLRDAMQKELRSVKALP